MSQKVWEGLGALLQARQMEDHSWHLLERQLKRAMTVSFSPLNALGWSSLIAVAVGMEQGCLPLKEPAPLRFLRDREQSCYSRCLVLLALNAVQILLHWSSQNDLLVEMDMESQRSTRCCSYWYQKSESEPVALIGHWWRALKTVVAADPARWIVAPFLMAVLVLAALQDEQCLGSSVVTATFEKKCFQTLGASSRAIRASVGESRGGAHSIPPG